MNLPLGGIAPPVKNYQRERIHRSVEFRGYVISIAGWTFLYASIFGLAMGLLLVQGVMMWFSRALSWAQILAVSVPVGLGIGGGIALVMLSSRASEFRDLMREFETYEMENQPPQRPLASAGGVTAYRLNGHEIIRFKGFEYSRAIWERLASALLVDNPDRKVTRDLLLASKIVTTTSWPMWEEKALSAELLTGEVKARRLTNEFYLELLKYLTPPLPQAGDQNTAVL